MSYELGDESITIVNFGCLIDRFHAEMIQDYFFKVCLKDCIMR